MGESEMMRVEGAEHLTCYENSDGDTMLQYFCSHCGSPMYVVVPDWPQWVYPRASAIDTPLPEPPEVVHVLLGEKANRVQPDEGDIHFPDNTEESIEDWHKRLGIQDVP